MAQMPVEVIKVGNVFGESIDRAVSLANSVQTEFVFSVLPPSTSQSLDILAFNQVKTEEFMDQMEGLRISIGGYHPFLIAFVDSALEGKDGYKNIFGGNRPKKGLAVFTVSKVPDVIVPAERMVSYFLYYLARCTLSFIVPEHTTHDDTRSCVFDRKINKLDLLQSMSARAFCDSCRRSLAGANSLSRNQFSALASIFDVSGNLKLTRRRAFVIHPSSRTIALPTDLSGITTASYDPNNKILGDAFRPACQMIREAIARADSIMRGHTNAR